MKKTLYVPYYIAGTAGDYCTKCSSTTHTSCMSVMEETLRFVNLLWVPVRSFLPLSQPPSHRLPMQLAFSLSGSQGSTITPERDRGC